MFHPERRRGRHFSQPRFGERSLLLQPLGYLSALLRHPSCSGCLATRAGAITPRQCVSTSRLVDDLSIGRAQSVVNPRGRTGPLNRSRCEMRRRERAWLAWECWLGMCRGSTNDQGTIRAKLKALRLDRIDYFLGCYFLLLI